MFKLRSELTGNGIADQAQKLKPRTALAQVCYDIPTLDAVPRQNHARQTGTVPLQIFPVHVLYAVPAEVERRQPFQLGEIVEADQMVI